MWEHQINEQSPFSLCVYQYQFFRGNVEKAIVIFHQRKMKAQTQTIKNRVAGEKVCQYIHREQHTMFEILLVFYVGLVNLSLVPY